LASTYVFDPVKSSLVSVPARIKVDTTSAGNLTSEAPLSTTKSSEILPLIVTGTTKTPPCFEDELLRQFSDNSWSVLLENPHLHCREWLLYDTTHGQRPHPEELYPHGPSSGPR
jgi:hypothetical protein